MAEINEQNQHLGHKEESGGGFNWRWILYGIIGVYFISRMFFGGEKDYYEEKLTEPTGGLITHVEEVKAEQFRITDEETVAAKEDTRIIATFLDGQIDTFTLDEATLTSNERLSPMRTVLYGGLMGYMMGKRMSTPTSASSYKNADTHRRVQGKAGKTMASTASTRTVRKPTSSKSGYGSGKSTKSYGG